MLSLYVSDCITNSVRTCSKPFFYFPPSCHVDLTTLLLLCGGNSRRRYAAGILWFFCGLSFKGIKRLSRTHSWLEKCNTALPGVIGIRSVSSYQCLPERGGIRGHPGRVRGQIETASKPLVCVMRHRHRESIVPKWPGGLGSTASIWGIYFDWCSALLLVIQMAAEDS